MSLNTEIHLLDFNFHFLTQIENFSFVLFVIRFELISHRQINSTLFSYAIRKKIKEKKEVVKQTKKTNMHFITLSPRHHIYSLNSIVNFFSKISLIRSVICTYFCSSTKKWKCNLIYLLSQMVFYFILCNSRILA